MNRSLLPITLLALSAATLAAPIGKPLFCKWAPESGMSDMPGFDKSGSDKAPGELRAFRSATFWSSTRVTLDAKGTTLRAVLGGFFDTAKVPYAIDPNLDAPIYASLHECSLAEAIIVLGRLSEFDVRSEGGVVYVTRRIAKGGAKTKFAFATATSPEEIVPMDPITGAAVPGFTGAISGTVPGGTPRTTSTRTFRATFPAGATPTDSPNIARPRIRIAKGTIAGETISSDDAPITDPKPTRASGGSEKEASASLLHRRISTNLRRTTLKAVLRELGRQSGAVIEIDPNVRDFKMDAVLRPTTLAVALEKICAAAHLRYRLRDGIIRISLAR